MHSRKQLKKELIDLFKREQVCHLFVRGTSKSILPDFIVCHRNEIMLFYLCGSTFNKAKVISSKAAEALDYVVANGGKAYAVQSLQHAKILLNIK